MRAALSTGNIHNRHTEYVMRSQKRMRKLGTWLWAVELDTSAAMDEALDLLVQNDPPQPMTFWHTYSGPVALRKAAMEVTVNGLEAASFIKSAMFALQEALANLVMMEEL